MLKLTRHLFSWEPSATLMDFYERGLFNHILASQDPATGGMIYYCPLLPGAFQHLLDAGRTRSGAASAPASRTTASTPTRSTSTPTDTLYVNLFIASELNWREKGLRVRQETRFPEQDSSRLMFTAAKPVRLAVKVRFPSWAVSGMSLAVNGAAQPVTGTAGLLRHGGPRVEERRYAVDPGTDVARASSSMPDDPKVVAFFYGSDPAGRRPGPRGADAGRPLRAERAARPAHGDAGGAGPWSATLATLPSALRPVVGAPLIIQDSRASDRHGGRDADPVLPGVRHPLHGLLEPLHARRNGRRTGRLSPRPSSRQRGLVARTIDTVDLGTPASEKAHDYQASGATQPDFDGRLGREAAGDGWFSYR